mmetsp:Transcript_24878/g.78956  ORF Transcript_24878/g.78956 Transcript_24878/m.78956 type:complete len:226 (+) Transcript_24878:1160-1837(+)
MACATWERRQPCCTAQPSSLPSCSSSSEARQSARWVLRMPAEASRCGFARLGAVAARVSPFSRALASTPSRNSASSSARRRAVRPAAGFGLRAASRLRRRPSTAALRALPLSWSLPEASAKARHADAATTASPSICLRRASSASSTSAWRARCKTSNLVRPARTSSNRCAQSSVISAESSLVWDCSHWNMPLPPRQVEAWVPTPAVLALQAPRRGACRGCHLPSQ